ncbi:MAG: hypothetical protein WC381_06360 [Kiritimatiellia bacterium]|jgi:hypothetical protein
MVDINLRFRRSLAHSDEARLKTALQHWHAIEPRADFESCVWRRICAAAAAESAAPGLWAIARGWLNVEPAWVRAVAAIIGIVAGVSAALSVPQTRADPESAASLLPAQTLTGAYLAMASGGVR